MSREAGTNDPYLDVDSVSVRFGGLQALDSISLKVPPASIIGLIGPNGAGKTTLFNCITGMVRPSAGRIRLFGQDVTDLPTHRRAQLGVGRTFQRLELFGSVTARENLVVAVEAHLRQGGLVSDMLALPRTVDTRAIAEDRADEVLVALGLSEYAGSLAGDLPAGLSRLVELGRALCTEPRLLLLDEPSSGLRAKENHDLAAFLDRTRREQGVSMLVVEHDMAFVLGLCDYVYVLDFGSLLAEGAPAAIRKDPVVQAAYLGEEVDDPAPAKR